MPRRSSNNRRVHVDLSDNFTTPIPAGEGYLLTIVDASDVGTTQRGDKTFIDVTFQVDAGDSAGQRLERRFFLSSKAVGFLVDLFQACQIPIDVSDPANVVLDIDALIGSKIVGTIEVEEPSPDNRLRFPKSYLDRFEAYSS